MDTVPLQLSYSNSPFFVKTLKERWPVILAQIIDSFYRNRVYYCDTLAVPADSLKNLTGAMAQLRYEITTNKPLTLLQAVLVDQAELDAWNDQLRKAGVNLTANVNLKEASDEPSWFGLPFLLTECYMYRRIMDYISLNGLGSFDPFALKKQAGLSQSKDLVTRLLDALEQMPSEPSQSRTEELFTMFVHATLWANEFDLSLHSDGNVSLSVSGTLSEHTKQMTSRIVVNDTHNLFQIWTSRLQDSESVEPGRPHTTALILDNSGPELVADLCLAEFLLRSGMTTRVFFYPKIMPWYVSDVTSNDLDWLLNVGLTRKTLDETLGSMAEQWADRWLSRFRKGEFAVRKSSFWTLPCPYAEIRKIDETLFSELLKDVNVMLFKGDLNYRKLVADRTWSADNIEHKIAAFRSLQFGRPTDSQGDVICSCAPQTAPGYPMDCRCPVPGSPSPSWPPLLCSFRVAKCDVAVGLSSPMLSRLVAESTDWWTSGGYGLIQVVSPIQMSTTQMVNTQGQSID